VTGQFSFTSNEIRSCLICLKYAFVWSMWNLQNTVPSPSIQIFKQLEYLYERHLTVSWLTCRSLLSVIVANFHSSDLGTFLSWKVVCMSACAGFIFSGVCDCCYDLKCYNICTCLEGEFNKIQRNLIAGFNDSPQDPSQSGVLPVLWYKVFQFIHVLMLKVYFDITNSVVINLHGCSFWPYKKDCAP
jgi:hypothetical protein